MTPYYPTVQLKNFQTKKAGFTIYFCFDNSLSVYLSAISLLFMLNKD